MNNQALKKCLIELDKESPSIPYIKGIIETIVEANEPVVIASQWQPSAIVPGTLTVSTGTNQVELSDEEREQEELARRYAGGPIAELQ